MKMLGIGIPELIIMAGVLVVIALPVLIVLLIIKLVHKNKESKQIPHQ